MHHDPNSTLPAEPNPQAQSTQPAQPRPRKPRSPAQIEASRRNGAQSHGPVSPEGKKRSAANSLKHGAFLRDPAVLGSESALDFASFVDDYLRGYTCADRAEYEIVHRMAVFQWHLKRYTAIETALLEIEAAEVNPGLSPIRRTAAAVRRLCENGQTLQFVSNMKLRYYGSFSRAQRDLFALQNRRNRQRPSDENLQESAQLPSLAQITRDQIYLFEHHRPESGPCAGQQLASLAENLGSPDHEK